jgi:hypothetical protein
MIKENKLSSLTLLLVLILSISEVAFAAKGPQTERSNSSQDSIIIDRTGRHQLEVYFSRRQIDQLEEYEKTFRNIKTAHDLHRAYCKIDSIYDGLADTLTAKQQRAGDSILDFDRIGAIVSGINFAHYEGSSVLINPELVTFKRAAEMTPEKCDDDFIAIMISTYGPEKFFSLPRWINQTWDYGGTSLLGEGIDLSILTQIQKALASSKEFEPELKEIRSTILSDILSAKCYEYDSSKILAEVNKIILNIKFSEEEKIKLNERLEELKNPTKEFQMNCAKKECKCGG